MSKLKQLLRRERELQSAARYYDTRTTVAKMQHFEQFKSTPLCEPPTGPGHQAELLKWEEARGHEDNRDTAREELAEVQAEIKRLKVAQARALQQEKQARREEEIRRRYGCRRW